MPAHTVEWEIPADWSSDDIVQWLNATLAEPHVRHLELARRRGTLVVRVVEV